MGRKPLCDNHPYTMQIRPISGKRALCCSSDALSGPAQGQAQSLTCFHRASIAARATRRYTNKLGVHQLVWQGRINTDEAVNHMLQGTKAAGYDLVESKKWLCRSWSLVLCYKPDLQHPTGTPKPTLEIDNQQSWLLRYCSPY